jgi:hypothetical protein
MISVYCMRPRHAVEGSEPAADIAATGRKGCGVKEEVRQRGSTTAVDIITSCG